jgi:polyribonucleotide nucleotidyltransferase
MEALAQARDGRLHILGKPKLASPKEVLKLTLKIITRRILMLYWALIGPGGK